MRRAHRDSDPGDDVALYIHWPYCARICPYCDFNVVRERGRAEEQTGLAAAILSDLEAQAVLTGPRRLASIFFGGGTPSLMDPVAVAAVIARAKALFPPRGEIEISLEANPTDAEAGRFDTLAAAGVNRLSMGVQALDDAALKFLGRNHSADEARRAVAVAARAFDRLSIDLIYARPDQTVEGWTAELTEALDMGFEHVSPYHETLNPRAAAEERVLLGLRTVEGVALEYLAVLDRSVTAGPLAGLIADGFLTMAAGRVVATAAGRPVLDGVLRALLV